MPGTPSSSRPRTHRLVLVLALLTAGFLWQPGAAGAETAGTTPVTEQPATTAAPPTQAPTQPPASSETPTSAGPTTPGESGSDDDGIEIGWAILLGLAALAVLLFVISGIRGGAKRHKAHQAWDGRAQGLCHDVQTTETLLLERPTPGAADDARWEGLKSRVGALTTELDGLAGTAPNDNLRSETVAVREAMRGLLFAIEADRLTRAGEPDALKLSQADAAIRTRRDELGRSLGTLWSSVSDA